MRLLEIGFKYFPVRLNGDMPEFEGKFIVNELGECSTAGTVLKLEDAPMRTWNIYSRPDKTEGLSLEISGKTFNVLPSDVEEAKSFFTQFLGSLKSAPFPED